MMMKLAMILMLFGCVLAIILNAMLFYNEQISIYTAILFMTQFIVEGVLIIAYYAIGLEPKKGAKQ